MYKCIFFDLDHTLWDYERNSRETLYEIFLQFHLAEKRIDFDAFCARFKEVNFRLWDLYDRGLIASTVIRNERFKQILETFHIMDDELALYLSDNYLRICPEKGNLIPHALDVIHYLSSKYNLTLITNGFDEIQHRKLRASNITHHFNHIITSQKAGCKKPAREIFEFALRSNNVSCSEAVMIGDNLITDIGGARNASIDTVFFNPDIVVHQETVKYEIKCLSELNALL